MSVIRVTSPLKFSLSIICAFINLPQSHFVHWSLVKEILAIGIIPHTIGDKEKSVERVLKSFEGISFSTWIVSHSELKINRRIRFVFDQLVEHFN